MVVMDQYTRRIIGFAVHAGNVDGAAASHPFVERLIGSVRRELLDQSLFWTATDLENKFSDYQVYYNQHRTHSGQDGVTPVEKTDGKIINISQYQWERHCRGIFDLPIAA
tara:strand:+ start:2313 stop:2642 length:330 start_codon:yes stop_codon:yes gene_type:complete